MTDSVESETVDPDSGTDNQQDVGYTAVIYFHGMGDQRRYEETSRLIDSIDTYLANSHRNQGSKGFLMKIKPRLEPGSIDPSQTFTHILTIYRKHPKDFPGNFAHFHEVYWAPVMAGQRSTIGVMKWMMRQIFRPIGTLQSPWRERQRLRRATLAALFEKARRSGQADPHVRLHDHSALVRLYDEFEGPKAIQKYPEGTFRQFLKFLEGMNKGRPDRQERHATLAKRWKWAYVREELRNAFVLWSLALAILLLAGSVVATVLVFLQRVTAIAPGIISAELTKIAPPEWHTAIGITMALITLVLGKFLTNYMGDVEAWATYEETDEKHARRAKVLEIGVETFKHVLGDPRCNRVVVVAHSLGTTIAHDTLLALTRFNRARNEANPISAPLPLTKIENFITLGSPIDKIEYFFESFRSPFHRYRRVIQNLRGDIGTAPFCKNRKPFIHWTNFWDDGDPVSGALHSPSGTQGFDQRVDNVHVANLTFPSPGTSHSAYFFNRNVIARIFDIIFLRAGSFQALPPRDQQNPDWESVFANQDIDPPGKRRFWTLITLALPWLSLSAVIAKLADPELGLWIWYPAAASAAAMLSGWLLSGRGKLRHPLTAGRVIAPAGKSKQEAIGPVPPKDAGRG